MRMDHVFTRGPGEDREPAVLGSNERHRVVLVADKLRGRKVPCASQLSRLNDSGADALDRLRQHHLSDLRAALPAHYFGAEHMHFIPVGDDGCAIDRGKAGDTFDCPAHRICPAAVRVILRALLYEFGQGGERRLQGVQHRLRDRLRPGIPP